MNDQERSTGLDAPVGEERLDRTKSAERGAADQEPPQAGESGSRGELSTRDLAQATGTREDATKPSAEPTDAPTGSEAEPLFEEADAERYRSRWHTVQASFVDEPRAAVEQADQLVAEVIQQLAKVFADERASLEAQWGRSGDISTEDLRVALRRYRSFFDRLLSV